MKTRFFIASLLVSALFFSGCAGTPPAPKPRPAVQQMAITPIVEDASLQPREQIVAWLEKAAEEEPPLSQHYQLRAVELLLREQQVELAEELLQQIDTSQLPPELLVLHSILSSRVLRNNGEFEQAIALLNNPALTEQADLVSLDRQIQLSQIRASLYSLQGMHLASVQERIYIDPLLNHAQQEINHDGIWHSLGFVPTAELMQHLHSTSNRDYLGWLELASIAKDNQGDIDAQLQQLRSWHQRWPDHPAADNLPGGLADLELLAATRPKQIALLLPVTGQLANYGKAIRDGFLASYFQTRSHGGMVPLIRSYDTNSAENITALYLQAVEDGAQMIIGPLTKESMTQLLNNFSRLPVPTLSLNRLDAEQFPDNLFQFGLAPEDEARQIANIARSKGFKRALVLTPEGSWGRNVADAFSTYWQSINGLEIDRAQFSATTKDYSKQLRDMLQLDLSQSRASKLRRIIGKKVEYEPRRRQDADFIFLVARPQEARTIKPHLAFHYAGDLPILATSHVYNGIPAPDKNRDIDGIQFVDIPWVLLNQSQERAQILKDLPRSRAYQRMYALGVDSFRLYPRLQQLARLDNSKVYGETGTLKLNNQRQIERELLLAVFENGMAINIPITDNKLDRDINANEDSNTGAFSSQ